MLALSVRVRNCVHGAYASGTYAHAQRYIKWCLAPKNFLVTMLYFSPKVTDPERLYGLKIIIIRAKISHLGNFKEYVYCTNIQITAYPSIPLAGDYNLFDGPFKYQSPHLTKFLLASN
jgi:hypothetical protein